MRAGIVRALSPFSITGEFASWVHYSTKEKVQSRALYIVVFGVVLVR